MAVKQRQQDKCGGMRNQKEKKEFGAKWDKRA